MINPHDTSASESTIQCYIVQEARKAGLLVHGDQNKAKRSRSAGGRAKAEGMLKGYPDMVFLLQDRVVWIELKCADGTVSKEQKELHQRMSDLGHEVYVVFAGSPIHGWDSVKKLLKV